MRQPVRPHVLPLPAVTTYRVFETESPPTSSVADATPVTVGVEFYVTSAASLVEVLWWQPTTGNDTQNRSVAVWTADGVSQVVAPFTSVPSGVGWQTATLSSPFALTPLASYRAAVFHPGGQFAATGSYFVGSNIVNGPLTVPNATNATGSLQGSFHYSGALAFPDGAFNQSNYWVDVGVQ